ncbi:MAG TPA: filamentous hemagglutinin N-terminal domain-containing protein, partial [Bacteroidia bacterium]|nr:filamentous hemagglutinin N-terminal domain-containing protein [Bacteroidia bacterium]
MLFTFYCAFGGFAAFANPTGGEIVSGTASISSAGSTLTVNQLSDRAIIHWQDFSIASGQTTQFLQPSATSAALNRVLGGNPSAIHGTLQSNGQIYLINPNGVLVGAGGVVNTGGFLASTLDVSDSDFLAGGDLRFKGDSTASVVNLGKISGSTADVILIAQTVENHGTIDAPNGTAALAAGSEVLVKASGQERVFVEAGSASGTSSATQAGLIRAAAAEIKAAGGNEYALAIKHSGVTRATGVTKRGGRVYLSAGGKGGISNSGTISARRSKGGGGQVKVQAGGAVVNEGIIDVSGRKGGKVEVAGEHVGNTGLILADGTVGSGGEVKLSASNQGVLIHSGVVSASGYSQGQKGGQVELTGGEVAVAAGSVVNASGDSGGGTVLIGGDYQGKNAAVPNARNTYVEEGSLIIADAVTSGNGGKVVLWADENTYFGGSIFARGGAVSGDGGFVETSGKANMAFRGWVDAGAANGAAGTLLLDPKNITVDELNLFTNGSFESGNLSSWTSSGDGSVVSSLGSFGPTEGGYMALIVTAGASPSGISQTISVESGISYALGFDYRFLTVEQTPEPSFNDDLRVAVSGAYTYSGLLADTYSVFYTGGGGYNEATAIENFHNVFVPSASGNMVVSVAVRDIGDTSVRSAALLDAFSLTHNYAGNNLFSDASSKDVTIAASRITAITNTGTAVVLQANNDITVNQAIVTNNPTGNGGSITMQAGRSILLNAGIITDNGNLTLVANETLANGVIDAHRDAGDAVITMAGGVKIDAGTGAVTITLADGAGKTNVGNGSIVLEDIAAGSITVSNLGGSAASDIVLNGQIGGTGPFEFTAGRTIAVNGTSSIQWSAPTTLTLNAGHNIAMNSGALIENTHSGANFDAIVLNAVENRTTGATQGINLAGATLRTTGSGNIALTGRGRNNGEFNYGILLNGAAVESTGTGTVTLDGTGGNGTNYNFGVRITGANSAVRSQSGAISITGLAQGSGTNNHGISLGNGSVVGSAGTAPITLTATGAAGAADFLADGASTIGGSSAGGNITINADTVSWGTNLTLRSTGHLVIQPRTATAAIGIGNGASGTLILNNNALSGIQDGFASITIGHAAGSGAVDVRGYTFKDDLIIRTPTGTGDIALNGALATGSGTQIGTITLQAGRSIIGNTGASITTQNRDITLNADRDATNGGNIQLTGTTVTSNGGKIVLGGGANPETTAAIGIGTGIEAQKAGIYLSGGSVNAGAGTIDMRGTGIAGTGGSVGIRTLASAVIGSATATGNITLYGTGGAVTGTGTTLSYNYGIHMTDSSAVRAADGAILLTGIGNGGGAGGSDHFGIHINGATVQSHGTGANAATVTLNGTGGTGSSVDNNAGTRGYGIGVYLANSAATQVKSADGNISIVGTGANVGGQNSGIYVSGLVESTGAATVSVTGTGGTSGTGNNYGVYVAGSNGIVRSTFGDVTITGTGGSGGNSNLGVIVNSNAKVQSIGTGADAAKLFLIGTGGAGVSTNQGIYMTSNGRVTSTAGAISFTGIGQGSGTNNHGIYIFSSANNGAVVESLGSATVTLHGTGSTNGTGTNHGVFLTDAGTTGTTHTALTSVNGAISITGVGNGSGASNYGVHLAGGAVVESTGTNAATVTLNGTGGAGTSDNYGIHLTGGGTRVQSAQGAILLEGTGGNGSGSFNHGIYLNAGAKVVSTDTATVTLDGEGGKNGFIKNHGVFLTGTGTAVESFAGDIRIDGRGGTGTGDPTQATAVGNRSNHHGVSLEAGAQVISTGTSSGAAAKITINGTGGSTTVTLGTAPAVTGPPALAAQGYAQNHGINMTDATTKIASAYGDIVLTGQGGTHSGGNASSLRGIYIAGATVQSTGTGTGAANIFITGTGTADPGAGTGQDQGIWFSNSAKALSVDGDITMHGHGNVGLLLGGTTATQIKSTGDGNLHLSGTA